MTIIGSRTALCLKCWKRIYGLGLTIKNLNCTRPSCKEELIKDFKQNDICVLFSSLATEEMIDQFEGEENIINGGIKQSRRLNKIFGKSKVSKKERKGTSFDYRKGDEILFGYTVHNPEGLYQILDEYNQNKKTKIKTISGIITYLTNERRLSPANIQKEIPLATMRTISNWIKKLGLVAASPKKIK